MTAARAEIFARIRRQLGPTSDAPSEAIEREYRSIPRHYSRAGSMSTGAITNLLLERLADYDAEVLETDVTRIANSTKEVLRRNGESVLLIPSALPAAWLPDGVEIMREPEQGSSALALATLTRAQAVLTPCAGAIAETGTILLEHGEQQGRRALTLLPDHHICVLRRDQIVETVSEGLALLSFDHVHPVTTVSGPSATADIEMTRIRGVHGPRRLTVLLVQSPGLAP